MGTQSISPTMPQSLELVRVHGASDPGRILAGGVRGFRNSKFALIILPLFPMPLLFNSSHIHNDSCPLAYPTWMIGRLLFYT